MNRNIVHIILFVGLFMLSLFIPIVDKFLNFLPSNVNNEKRELANLWDKNASLSFFKNYVTYFSDNFNGRSLLIHGYINIKSKLLHTSPLPQKVIIGKNGYKFLVNYNSMDDYRNVHSLPKATLDSIGLQLSNNQRFLDSLGIKYYVLIIPTKPRIYPEYLPDFVKMVRSTSRLDQLKKYKLSELTTLQIIDLTDTLKASKTLGELYFKGDSHWNELGAFIGYRKLMEYIQKDFPEIPGPSLEDYILTLGNENDLDLDKMLGRNMKYSEPAIKLIPKFQSLVVNLPHEYKIPDSKKRNPNYVISKGNIKGKRKLIMFRDSFSATLTQFMSESFEQSIFIWKYSLDRDFIIKEKPDIVVQQLVERHIDLLKS